MKRVTLVAIAVLSLGPVASADFLDSFDSYAAGSQAHGQGGWKGWDNDPTWGALVTTAQAASPPNSVEIIGASDLVHTFSDMTSGQWSFTAQQYIPSTVTSGTSYFILLNQYNDGGPYNWSVQLPCDLAAGTIRDDLGASNTVPLIRDQWVEIKADINLAANTVQTLYGGQPLSTHAWSDLGGGGLAEVQAIDLFANGAGPVYYDDIRTAAVAPPPPPPPPPPIVIADFDGGGTVPYAFTNSSGAAPAVLPGGASGSFARLTNLSGSNSNSIAFDMHPSATGPAEAIHLGFDFSMTDDATNNATGGCCGFAADGLGVGLFSTAAYGGSGPSDPAAATGRVWERPSIPNAFVVGLDIYPGTDGNNVTLNWAGTQVADAAVPFQLNASTGATQVYHQAHVVLTAQPGGNANVQMDIIEDVNGAAVTHNIFNNVVVAGMDLENLFNYRVVAGGRTGGAWNAGDVDNIRIGYTAAPTPPLLAHWEFNEGSGTAANSSVGGWTGTLVNFPDTSAGVGDIEGAAGWTSDGRLNFNRMGGQAGAARVETNLPIQSTLGGNSFTIEMVGTVNDEWQNWSPGIGQDGGCCFFFGKTADQPSLHVNFAGLTSFNSSILPTIADGQQHHMAAVFNDVYDTLEIFYDGDLVGRSTGVTGTLADRGNLWFGSVAHQPVAEHWNGAIDDIRIHGGVLRPDQFLLPAALAPLPSRPTTLLADWQFGEGSGPSANSSVGGWTGTLVNFPDTGPGVGDPVGQAGWTSDGRVNLNRMGGQPGAARVSTDFPIQDQLGDKSFSIEFIATHNNPTQGWSPLIGQSGGCCFFFGKRSGQERLHYNIAGLAASDSGFLPVADGQPHHMALVFDADTDTMSVYFDYQCVRRQSGVSGALADRGNLWLGSVAHQPVNEYWNGYVDQVRIWEGVLSPGQFLGAPPPGPPRTDPILYVTNAYNSVSNMAPGPYHARKDALFVVTNGVADNVGNDQGVDTWNNRQPDTDFTGLIYPGRSIFDTVTVDMGNMFWDGGQWSAEPKLYLLTSLTDTRGTAPETSPHWVEVPGAVLVSPTGFDAAADPNPTPNRFVTFDLTGLPFADRMGYGWAVGGVSGDGAATFISVSELSDTTSSSAQFVPLTPSNVVSTAYHTIPGAADGDRVMALWTVTDGIVEDDGGGGRGWDTWHGTDPGSDFVGLLYAEEVTMDRLIVYLGNQFFDGGSWVSEPNVYILKNPVDTDTTAPETDPANWLQVDAKLLSFNIFDAAADVAGGGALSEYPLIAFDLTGLDLADRTGYGWAVGGVPGDGGASFISVAELMAYQLVPEPTTLGLLGLGALFLARRRRRA